MEVHICEQLNQQVNDVQENIPVQLDAINLQNFVEDCLIHIMLDTSLDLIDLCSLGETCKRFRRIVQRVIIPKTLYVFECTSYYEIRLGKYYYRTEGKADIERVFKIFGPYLAEVWINASPLFPSDHTALQLVDRYCDDELKILSIRNVRISEVLANKLKPVFKRLQKLCLFECEIDGDKSQFAELDSIVALEVEWVTNSEGIVRNVFPGLKRFTYSYFGQGLLNDQKCWMTIMPTIVNSTELEELRVSIVGEFFVSSEVLEPLRHLKSLRILDLWSVSFSNFEVFAPITNLSELDLSFCNVINNCDSFALLAGLTKLSISYWSPSEPFNRNDIVNIISHLVKLEGLEVDDQRTVIDDKTFLEIVAIVKGRQRALTLTCYFDFDLKKYDEIQTVKPVSVLSTYVW